jgi:hypothetical protein
MHALLGDIGGNASGYRDLCTRIWDAGLLDRCTYYSPMNETQSYYLSQNGTEYLNALGIERPDYNTTKDAHQRLLDIALAQFELGSSKHGVEFHPWVDIRDNPNTPTLPENPLVFKSGSVTVIPDGDPFYLKNSRGAVILLRELDRNTEKPQTIKAKLQNYKVIIDLVKQRYGCSQVFLLFITTNKTREKRILEWIKEEFPQGCKWILTQTMQDHVTLRLSTVPVATHLIDEPYNRAFPLRFSLATLTDVQ